MKAAAVALAVLVSVCVIQAHAQSGAALSDAIKICNQHLISSTGYGLGYAGRIKFDPQFQDICTALSDRLDQQRDEQLRQPSQLDLARLKHDLGMTP